MRCPTNSTHHTWLLCKLTRGSQQAHTHHHPCRFPMGMSHQRPLLPGMPPDEGPQTARHSTGSVQRLRKTAVVVVQRVRGSKKSLCYRRDRRKAHCSAAVWAVHVPKPRRDRPELTPAAAGTHTHTMLQRPQWSRHAQPQHTVHHQQRVIHQPGAACKGLHAACSKAHTGTTAARGSSTAACTKGSGRNQAITPHAGFMAVQKPTTNQWQAPKNTTAPLWDRRCCLSTQQLLLDDPSWAPHSDRMMMSHPAATAAATRRATGMLLLPPCRQPLSRWAHLTPAGCVAAGNAAAHRRCRAGARQVVVMGGSGTTPAGSAPPCQVTAARQHAPPCWHWAGCLGHCQSCCCHCWAVCFQRNWRPGGRPRSAPGSRIGRRRSLSSLSLRSASGQPPGARTPHS